MKSFFSRLFGLDRKATVHAAEQAPAVDPRAFHVEHAPGDRSAGGNYEYRIYRGGRLVARYWHDFRGDEHWIKFADGGGDDWPVGRVADFLEGGGPQTLRLSARAVAYLEKRLAE